MTSLRSPGFWPSLVAEPETKIETSEPTLASIPAKFKGPFAPPVPCLASTPPIKLGRLVPAPSVVTATDDE